LHQNHGNNLVKAKTLSLLIAALLAGLSFHSARADSAKAWGYDGWGQLGNASTTDSYVPVDVSNMASGVTAVAAGFEHSLAIQNGKLFAWGYNAAGQLGLGNIANHYTPVLVTNMSSGVTAATAGNSYSLAIQNGALFAWGDNTYGQLGNGSSGGVSNVPVAVSNMGSGVTAVAAGGQHTLAIQNGKVFAWGLNTDGQLGYSTGMSNISSTPTGLSLGAGVTAVAAGQFHSLALLNGGLYAWGENAQGQLGIGSIVNISITPSPVMGLSSGVTAIAAGNEHNLAVQNGVVFVWGSNTYGQLGNGFSGGTANTPTAVTSLSSIVAVAACGDSSYALSSDGGLWVWGRNDKGQLGLGNTMTQTTPQPLPPQNFVFTSIAVGAAGLHVVGTVVSVHPLGNHAPVAQADFVLMPDDTNPISIDVLANDSDPDGDRIKIISVSTPPTRGTATVSNGKINYTPGANFKRPTYQEVDGFTYMISDSFGGTASARVTVSPSPFLLRVAMTGGLIFSRQHAITPFQIRRIPGAGPGE
jgi:alpha-tubulin suppressor-like RCC1 family protein